MHTRVCVLACTRVPCHAHVGCDAHPCAQKVRGSLRRQTRTNLALVVGILGGAGGECD